MHQNTATLFNLSALSEMPERRLNFMDIKIDSVPTVYPSLEEMMSPNNIDQFINNPEIYNLGMEYGMIKIAAPQAFRHALVNNLENKETDLNFKIKIREQVLNELELGNRSNKLFEKQLEAFDKISGVQHEFNKRMKTDDTGCEISLYDLYVKIMTTYNSQDVDECGRFVKKPTVLGKRSINKIDVEDQQNTQKKRRSSRIKNISTQSTKASAEAYDNNGTANECDQSEWMVPDPKTCRFLQMPLKHGNVQPSTHAMRFWKSIGSNYAEVYLTYQKHLKGYIASLHKYEGRKPWSCKESFKSNGISILHHINEDSAKNEPLNVEAAETLVDVCRICQRSKKLYQCEYCLETYHKGCIPYVSGKKGKLCDNCFLGNFEYGFQELDKKVSIKEFKNMCEDSFEEFDEENDLLNIEKQFWSIVYGDERVKTYYGADVHNDTKNYISGFENQPSESIRSSFLNLMNLPNDKHTLLPLLTSITGISLPWCYFGSKFSVFGIHLEDHFTYSVNYQFSGHPKIWYCIKISDSDKFHEYIKQKYPDFLKRQKDILHQLTMTISPYDVDLHEKIGIKFFKACQKPYEYIITFPKCWHFGFNLGFNHNEAVNFILPNWIPYAIEADGVYRRDGRKNVFDIYKLIQKNIVVNHDNSYSEKLFEHVKKVIEKIQLGVEIIMKEKLIDEYTPTRLDLSPYSNSYLVNEVSCDNCKKICSFAMVLVFQDYELHNNKQALTLNQILQYSQKVNDKSETHDYENLNNFISNHSDNEHKALYLYCVDCYVNNHIRFRNYLTTEIVYMDDELNRSVVFVRDELYGLPVSMNTKHVVL